VVRRLRTDEEGITPVLGAALVIGVIITVFSAFLAVWVPGETNRKEREHMLEVEGSFRELSAKIEGLEVGESKSVYVKMSPEPLPFISSPGTGGTLSALPSAGENYGVVKFSLGNQSLVYESGMVILVQNNENLMKSAPRVVTVREVGDKLEVHFNIIKVCGLESSVSGTGTSTITVSVYQENLLENREPKENVVIQINENTSYKGAWEDYLQELNAELEEKGCHPEVEDLQLTILGNDNTSDTKDIYYYEKVTKIWVSIS
jgi:hypothetical protein